MVLYGARGSNIASDLYIIDPSDASETSVGNTGHGLTGLAFHPTSGVLYGSTSNQSPLNLRSLVTVNPANGVTTLVGGFGIGADTLSDIAFDSTGTLYGYAAGSHKLYTVNLGTGAATQVSATTVGGGFGFGMDFDSGDNLFVLPFGDDLTPPNSQILLVDQTDASQFVFSHVTGSPPYGNGASFAAGAFAPSKVFYAIDNNFNITTHLVSVVIGTGEVVDIGAVTTGMDALASDTRATNPWAYSFAAPSIINASCATASVVAGPRVREDWPNWWNFGSEGYTREETTFKLTWAGDAGLYRLAVFGQLSANGSGVVNAIAIVNGRPFLGVRGSGFTNTTPDDFTVYNGFNVGTYNIYDPLDRAQNPWLPLTPGDIVEIQIMSAADLTGFAGFNAFECSDVLFMNDPVTDTAFCTGAANFDDVPLGDDWGDFHEWGGQRLIPDEIYTHLGFTPDSHTSSDFPWGLRWVDYDMVALEDGTVYFFVHDGFPTGSSPPSTDTHYIAVKKYDPGAGTWSQIATFATPTGRKPAESVSCEYDGTYVYFAWWECTTFTPGVPALYQSDWHLVRLDPSDDSYTELGTGQHAVTVGAGAGDETDNAEVANAATLAPHICVSGDDVYVAAVEMTRFAPGTFGDWRRPYVWRWDGATWTNLNIPDPSYLGPTFPYRWEVAGENGFWDQLVIMAAADANGPITDGITVVYTYLINDNGDSPTVTIPYTTGGGWGTEILTDFVSIEGSWYSGLVAYDVGLIDHNIMWSDKLQKLVLAGDLLRTSTDNNWEMYQMNDAGTQWEHLDNVLAPPSSAADWRQSRNTTAIGPDGDIWRGMMADEVGTAFNFEPHVVKNADGYSFGYANGSRKPMGRIVPYTDPQGNVWSDGLYIQMSASANCRIRWSGNTCYIATNLFVEPGLVNGQDFDTYAGTWPVGEGLYVLKGTYVPCGGNVPLFRPRVFSVSNV